MNGVEGSDGVEDLGTGADSEDGVGSGETVDSEVIVDLNKDLGWVEGSDDIGVHQGQVYVINGSHR